jgi:hypothetical protein
MKPRRSVDVEMLPYLSLVPSKSSQINSKVSNIIENQKHQQSKNYFKIQIADHESERLKSLMKTRKKDKFSMEMFYKDYVSYI